MGQPWIRRAAYLVIVVVMGAVGVIVDPPGASAAPSVVRVSGGAVTGISADGVTQYLGVPFGSAKRFAPPGAAKPWAGVRRAASHGPQCPQAIPGPITIPSTVPIPVPTSEDCLSVDLYVPPGAAGKNLPVMVYLFGGAFVLGATWQYDSPAELARTGNVIIAVPNYRVGPFGFLSLPELAAANRGVSGTFGTADQQFALRWVHDNIGRFGGNPGDVTLFGESAGGMSVCTQIAAPGSRGLFTKAIIESGACAQSPLVPPSQAEGFRRSADYAASLGCGDVRTRLACLRRLPVDRLLDSPTTKFDTAAATWTPFIDGTIVTRTPEQALRAGAAADIPLIVGSNADEGRLFTVLFDYAKGRIPTEASFRSAVRQLYPDRADRILAAYPVSTYRSPAAAMSAVYTDSLFACPAQVTTEAATAGGGTVWQYRFTAAPLGPNPLLPGAFHASELPYIFSRLGGVPIPWTGPSAQLAVQMKRQWYTFARTGRPNATGLPDWTPWSAVDQQFLSIDVGRSVMRGGFRGLHDCGLWTPTS